MRYQVLKILAKRTLGVGLTVPLIILFNTDQFDTNSIYHHILALLAVIGIIIFYVSFFKDSKYINQHLPELAMLNRIGKFFAILSLVVPVILCIIIFGHIVFMYLTS